MGHSVVIAVIDDIVRIGLHAIFKEAMQVSDIQDVVSNKELQTLLTSHTIDMVVIDQALDFNLNILPQGRFVILAIEPEISLLQAAYKHGARGYLSLHASKELLHMALDSTKKSFLIDPTMTSWIMPYLTNITPYDLKYVDLTQRQREVDQLIREGLSRHAIAEQLSIADSTVKTHLKHIYQKRRQAQQIDEM